MLRTLVRLRLAAVVTCLAVLSISSISGRASAQQLDSAFWVVDGAVNSTALLGDTLYVGGHFRKVGPSTGSFAELDPVTGAYSPGWPRVSGQVLCAVDDGVGGWYVGGTFESVDGVARPGLAHLLANRTLGDWNPVPDGRVFSLARAGSTLYVGGDFRKMGAVERLGIAAFDIATGELAEWAPAIPGEVREIVPNGSTIYVGGGFDTAAGVARSCAVELDAVTAQPTAWDPQLGVGNSVYSILRIGNRVLLAGSLRRVGGVPRFGVVPVDAVSGALSAWNPDVRGDVFSLAIDSGILYVGGEFQGVAGQARSNLAAFDLSTETLTGWNPGTWNQVRAVAVSEGSVYVGGIFWQAGGADRAGLAAIDQATGAVRAWDPNPNGDTEVIIALPGRVFVGGPFSTACAVARSNLLAIDVRTNAILDWNPGSDGGIDALVAIPGHVYAGGGYSMIGGQDRWCIADLDPQTGQASHLRADTDQSPVYALALADGVLYAGGEFQTMNGVPRQRMAAVDVVTGAVMPWNPAASGPVVFLKVMDGVIHASGNFNEIGGAPRAGYAELDATTGIATGWDPLVWGPVLAIEKYGDLIYMGGNFQEIQGISRNFLASINTGTKQLTSWNPNADGGGVGALAQMGGRLFAGGNFTEISGQPRASLASIDLASGGLTAWDPGPRGSVKGLTIAGGSIYASGAFQRGSNLREDGLRRYVLDPNDHADPQVRLVSPNGGEAAYLDEQFSITWIATDDVGVQCVDIQLSRNGRTGPWEELVSCIPNTGSYSWTVVGPPSNFDAFVRVIAHDASARVSSDLNDEPFTITSRPVPTLVELFRLEDTAEGVAIHWMLSHSAAGGSVAPQRALGPAGEWREVGGLPLGDGRVNVLVDRAAVPDVVNWYRLEGALADGTPVALPPISLLHSMTSAFSLEPFAPNPARTSTQLSFALPHRARVTMSLLDVQGREVAQWAEVDREAGRHAALLDVSSLRAGLYFLRLRAQGAELRQRLIVVR